ncbi:MAG TPA: FtsX-like permease family protein [Longimicrobiales bacterium]|nr:FtsX-like permease family protein [Longimicrobiales bacterium]
MPITPVVRTMLRTPRPAIVVVATLAVAMALVTTVFSTLNAYAWRSLPYPSAHRNVAVGIEDARYSGPLGWVQPVDVAQVRGMTDVFARVAAHATTYPSIRVDGAAFRAPVVRADITLLPLLGAEPAIGRLHNGDDEDVAVLTHAGWQRRFAGDANVAGRGIYLDGRRHTVVGVLAEGFAFENAELFVPLPGQASGPRAAVLARLADGVSFQQAEARVRATRLEGGYDADVRFGISSDMMQRANIARAGFLPWLFLCCAMLVLLAACANVVTILLARAVAREPQYAVRAALGASRRRLAAESVLEALLLAGAATLLAVLLSAWTLRLLPLLLPGELPSWIRLGVDLRVLAFAALVGLVATVLVALAPARYAAATDLQLVMKGGGAGGRRPRQARTTRRLVAFEIAVSVSLFATTLLLVRSEGRYADFNTGLDDRHVLAFDVHLPPELFPRHDAVADYVAESLRRLALQPGVAGASWHAHPVAIRATSQPDRPGRSTGLRVTLAGGEAAPPRSTLMAVGDAYFATVGLRMLHGRDFQHTDTDAAPLVAVVSREFALRAWGDDGTALGMTLVVDTAGGSSIATVVGVAGDEYGLSGNRSGTRAEAKRVVYLASRQVVPARPTFLARTAAPDTPVGPFAAALANVNRDAPIENPGTIRDRLRLGLDARIFAMMFGIIGAAALALAVIGLYGVVSYSTEQRTREIGVRVALGASPARIARDVIVGALAMAAGGLLLGALLAAGFIRVIRGLLYGVSPLDPGLYVVVATFFLGVAALAAYLPGRRAMRVDPAVALRSE